MSKTTWAIDGDVRIMTIAGTELKIDISKIPETAKQHCFEYGLKRRLYDCHGGKDKSDADRIAASSAAIDAILAGGWDIRGAAGRFYMESIDFDKLSSVMAARYDADMQDAVRAKVAALVPMDEDDDKTAAKKRKTVKDLMAIKDIAEAMGMASQWRDPDDILGL